MPNMGGIDVARITREKLGPECPAAEPAVHLAVEYSIEFSSPRLRQKDQGSRVPWPYNKRGFLALVHPGVDRSRICP
jgi:hypothetical protein